MIHCEQCGQPLPMTDEEKRKAKADNARRSMALAKERGTIIGRPRTYDYSKARSLRDAGLSFSAIAGQLKCSVGVVQNALKERGK